MVFEYGELGVADARRLRALVSENGRLKRLRAEACLHIEALKLVFNARGESARRKLNFISERRPCRLVGVLQLCWLCTDTRQ